MSEAKTQVSRVAMRVEGDWWVAYIAPIGTMEGALELGRTRMTIVQDPDRKSAFIDVFASFAADVLEAEFGERADMVIHPAPEHERAGRA